MLFGNWFHREEIKKSREAVVWIALTTAFLVPCVYYYQKQEDYILQMNLVSENRVIQAGIEQSDLDLHAKGVALYDATNQRLLYGENEDLILPMASTTKIMTCILAIESECLNDITEVSAYAATQPKVHAGLKTGEQYYMKDLLYSLMLESHNDTAVVIAEHIGGSVEGFAELMNQKAAELGMENSYFITPNGLDASKGEQIHSTTARDLAILSAYAINNPEFVAIVNTANYSFQNVEGTHTITVSNKNAFLGQMDGAVGIKTGFTGNAGYCFAGAVHRDSITLVSVVLACGWPPHKSYKWADTRTLMQYGFEHYNWRNIQIPITERVMNGPIEERILISADSMETNQFLSDYDEIILCELWANECNGPIEENTIVGRRNLIINGQIYDTVSYCCEETINEETYRTDMEYLLDLFIL